MYTETMYGLFHQVAQWRAALHVMHNPVQHWSTGQDLYLDTQNTEGYGECCTILQEQRTSSPQKRPVATVRREMGGAKTIAASGAITTQTRKALEGKPDVV